uniref:Enoyl reductase (ER) domain-containing protein n=1 Tax=Dunaliella tertiolecta TaxID=3047 RepID=A0A7S3QL23_DUNTE
MPSHLWETGTKEGLVQCKAFLATSCPALAFPSQGTWRTRGVFNAKHFWRVPRDLPLEAAATLCVNPTTALAMLERFVPLSPGDVVVQNGATSAVGQAVIQLAKAKGLQTVNIIRDRPNWAETEDWLKKLGADVVTTEEKLLESLKQNGGKGPLADCKLGLNCVGGSSAVAVAKALCEGGTMVTYGGMSMQPVNIPTSLLIFKDLNFRGFWLSGRFARTQPNAQKELLAKVVQYIQEGHLQVRTKEIPLERFQEALALTNTAYRDQKVLLSME